MKAIKTIVNRGVVICLLIVTGCIDVSFQERMARQAQCIPPPYSVAESLNPAEETYRQIDVDEPISEVADYYFDILTPVDATDSFLYNTNGLWRVQEITGAENGKLYDCYDSINRFTQETGCIFLHVKDDEETTVEYIWNLGELAPGCSSHLNQ